MHCLGRLLDLFRWAMTSQGAKVTPIIEFTHAKGIGVTFSLHWLLQPFPLTVLFLALNPDVAPVVDDRIINFIFPRNPVGCGSYCSNPWTIIRYWTQMFHFLFTHANCMIMLFRVGHGNDAAGNVWNLCMMQWFIYRHIHGSKQQPRGNMYDGSLSPRSMVLSILDLGAPILLN